MLEFFYSSFDTKYDKIIKKKTHYTSVSGESEN